MSATELYNFAKINKVYREAATNVYGDKYKTLDVYFKLSEPDDIFQAGDNKIAVLGIVNCTRYIELFNEHILFLHIDYGGADNVSRFNEILAEHCAETLNEFSFWGLSEEVIMKYLIFHDNIFDIQTPFTRVHTLRILNTNLRDSFSVISRCFPGVYDLELYDVTGTNFSVKYNSLRRLTLRIEDIDLLDAYEPLLKMNPDIGQLKIASPDVVPLDRVLTLVENNQAIEKLIVDAHPGRDFSDHHLITRLIEEHEQLRELRVENQRFHLMDIMDLLRSSEIVVLICSIGSYRDKFKLQRELEAYLGEAWTELTDQREEPDLVLRLVRKYDAKYDYEDFKVDEYSGPPGLIRIAETSFQEINRSPSFMDVWNQLFPGYEYRND